MKQDNNKKVTTGFKYEEDKSEYTLKIKKKCKWCWLLLLLLLFTLTYFLNNEFHFIKKINIPFISWNKIFPDPSIEIPTYKGLKFNDVAYNKIPTKAMLSNASYIALPRQFSLKPYCPEPKNQGRYGTCVGWATGYAARTIAYAYTKGWKNQTTKITENAFSPLFVYASIHTDVNDCSTGTYPGYAVEILKNKGVPFFKDYPVKCANCELEIPTELFPLALQNKIETYAKLFENGSLDSIKIKSVKKSIENGNPVVIGMNVYNSFDKAKGVWNGEQDGGKGGHALCVIGWDDDKHGGAFEIINSWGKDWGNDGYIWVTYSDFAINTKYAFEIDGIQQIDTSKVEYDFEGELKFIQNNNDTMRAECLVKDAASKLSKESESHYKMLIPYKSGTKYRIHVTNMKPAYVYVISSDLTNVVNQLFPHNSKISAYLNYKGSTIILPDEEYYYEIDATPGADYVCVLFSKDELDIDLFSNNIKSATGTFLKKIETVFNTKLINKANIDYNKNKIAVKAKSNGKIILPIIIEMEHTN